MVCIYSGILVIKRKETGSFKGMWIDLCCHTEWINQKEKKVQYMNTYMWNLETDFNRSAGQEQICQWTDRWHRREAEGVAGWETGTATHTPASVKQSWGDSVYLREVSSVSCEDQEVRMVRTGDRLKRQETDVYLSLMHTAVHQKPTKHCEATGLWPKTEKTKEGWAIWKRSNGQQTNV